MDDNHDDVSQWPMIYGSNIQDELNHLNVYHLFSTELQEFPKNDAVDSVMSCEFSFGSRKLNCFFSLIF